ncbi:Frigida-like protein [Artemisia annua]|uniref:FRIGIDA-like protein n=1 Tax=Artemisia annua TaxID=35608 RepID=A0A2U1QDW4_ARTAN|nr:Frigida-like protein [Artemisia annua]
MEDHKLQNHYPLDPIQKRILQLEKAKVEKKRVMEVSKPQHKRPRANGVAAGYMPRNTNYARSMHHQLSTPKVEKKRVMEVSKPQHKRPRANGVAAGYMPRNTNYARSMHHQLSTRMTTNPTVTMFPLKTTFNHLWAVLLIHGSEPWELLRKWLPVSGYLYPLSL